MAARAISVSFLEHGLATLRMQRGDNRLNNDFIAAFHGCLDEVESNKDCRGLITTGEGKFFSNGIDVQWLVGQNRDAIKAFMQDFHKLTARLLTFPVPTVAALNGHSFAGGAVLAMAHDLRVMNSEKGWICLNEIFLGLRLSPCHVKMIQSKLTPTAYHNMFAFGQRLTGPEAESAAVIDKAVPASELEMESQKLLKAWIGKDGFPRESLQNMKKDIYEDSLKDLVTNRLVFPANM